MSTLQRFLRAAALSAAVGAAFTLAPVAGAANFGGGGFHGGGFHGGFAGGGFRGGSGMHGGGFHSPAGGLNRTANIHELHSGSRGDGQRHRHGHWENGVWIGVLPGYYGNPYDDGYGYDCDPESPYYDVDFCDGD